MYNPRSNLIRLASTNFSPSMRMAARVAARFLAASVDKMEERGGQGPRVRTRGAVRLGQLRRGLTLRR